MENINKPDFAFYPGYGMVLMADLSDNAQIGVNGYWLMVIRI
jgi:hypothetical protein